MSFPADDHEDRPQRRSEAGRESRDRILDAAEKLFIERGVANTSFAAIQREAKISRGSIPWHFEHKAGLLLAIVERATIVSSLDHERDSSLHDLIEQMKVVLRRPQAALLSALSAESNRPDSPSHGRYREWHSATRRAFGASIESTEGFELPAGVEADALGAVLFGAIIGLGQQWLLAPELVDLDKGLEALDRIFTIALTAGADGSRAGAPE